MKFFKELFLKLKDKKILRQILIGVILIIFIAILGILSLHEWKGGAVGDGSTKFEIEVEPGETANKVAKELKSNKMIHSSKYFLYLLKFSGNISNLKQGIYVVNDGMSTWKIIKTLVEGRVKTITFTIPEGYTNRQIGDVLVKKKIVSSRDDFIKEADNSELLKKYKIPAKTSEGYLYPETYTIPYDYKPSKVAEMMIRRFFSNLEKVEGANRENIEELHSKVVLASIVEREAKKKDEQPLMAGVFLKRIKIGMPLESCATVQYLFDKPKKRLLEKDLEIVSPYNTYLNKGYPPGPISNPGLPALRAAYKPTESDSLFFLVKPDGSHYFSRTHKEHLEAKKKYIDVLYE
ncbi:MAG: endolytic transglycosylase MltG [Leptospiraceae bacterium]|nr:endolytic transglycosylase MltG [Leptospiraceae bacterium]